MSGGSNDDAVLAIAHRDADGHAVLDAVINQGQHPPFDPNKAVERFVRVLRDYRVSRVTGDRYAGLTFSSQFTMQGITYEVARHTTSDCTRRWNRV
jgi:predicted phosphohydrolase